MEIIIGAIVFGLIIIAIIVMLVINFTYRSIKKRREEMEDDHYHHLKEKEQKEKHPFGKDYFKSAAPKKQQTTKQNKPKAEKPVTTDSNVRIYDEREASDKRKIFDDKEGEYVEFEEV